MNNKENPAKIPVWQKIRQSIPLLILYSSIEQLQVALWAYIFLRLGFNNDNLYSHPPSQIYPSPISPPLVLPLQTLRLLSLVGLMTKTKRMIVDNLFRWFQNSGTKSRGDFTFCTAAAILRCTFCPALLPKCGTMWKTTWLHNVGNIRQKDINPIPPRCLVPIEFLKIPALG